ncbi:hypothetical protein [Cellulomonas marina]|uniref:Uncharacterized protein n=1 Tax=Cellulomonas marina TaxID=988821 RepID=A0A1I0V1E9_9CELL|nr:hypothetical protein [Cellulomonas marina]GIG28264.1 hypothetical protein Cma02nite_08640 [Cellulomonas marina]SFA70179.1 hypothetical protein SAMN05421867_10191 [Cellulomonas marina]
MSRSTARFPTRGARSSSPLAAGLAPRTAAPASSASSPSPSSDHAAVVPLRRAATPSLPRRDRPADPSALALRASSAASLTLLRLGRRLREDRGDVPGWVLVTLMTAGLVTALWVVARPVLEDVFRTAIAGVTGA